MASRNFLLVSLEESKAKQLAQIVSSSVCRKILDHLSAKGSHATEMEISRELSIPLSTVHYNLKQLLQSGIVKAEEFHYSKKGREVLHYSLANKYIIIAPTAADTEGLASKLKKILPVLLVVAGAGAVIKLFSTMRSSATALGQTTQASIMEKAAETTALQAQALQAPAQQPSVALWFVLGGLFALAAYFGHIYISGKLRQKG